MPSAERNVLISLHTKKILYVLTLVLSSYLLFTGRSEEVYTVWQVLHPTFIPVFFVATLLLLMIIFSSEKLQYKLVLIVAHSILCHSLFVIIFPAGNVGVQQAILAQTRLVFENTILHGFGWGRESIPLQMYVSLRGENLQAAFSVIFARMLGIDVYWTHLLLVPLLWGTFIPIIAFIVSETLGGSENISALSSLVVTLFPANIIWGAVSIPNGLSYLFFFCFVCFLLKYIKSNRRKDLLLVATFLFSSFLSHFLAGIIALSLFVLAYSIKTYRKQKQHSPTSARFTLLLSFIFCTGIMPFALTYRRFFYPTANTYFSLQKLYEYSPIERILSLLFGSYFDLISREAYMTTLIFGAPTLLGLVALAYFIITGVKKSPTRSINSSMLFISLGLLMIVVDDRIVKLFMVNVPFAELERLWLFRDFFLVPFTALIIGSGVQKMRAFFITFFRNTAAFLRQTFFARMFFKVCSVFTRSRRIDCVSLGSVSAYILVFTIVSGWVTASIYYAYPHWGPLQTTSYELEAARYIDETTSRTYIVICDQWMIFAGGMFAGINNQRAFYFSYVDRRGVTLFIEMKKNPSNEILAEAMEINNATTGYFIIEKPRLGPETYSSIINQAQQNNLQTYKVFYYPEGKEKLRIFYYQSNTST